MKGTRIIEEIGEKNDVQNKKEGKKERDEEEKKNATITLKIEGQED